MARTKVVSWLRTASLTFPALPSQWLHRACVTVSDTVAGPHRLQTGFRGSRPRINCESKLFAFERVRKNGDHDGAENERKRD